MKHSQKNHVVAAVVMSILMAVIIIFVVYGIMYLVGDGGNQIPAPLILLVFAVVFISGSVFFEKQIGVDKVYSMVGGIIVALVVIFILITLGNGLYYAFFDNGLYNIGFDKFMSSIAILMIVNMFVYNYFNIVPKIADKIDFGNLDAPVEKNGNTYEKDPFAIGIHEAMDISSSPIMHTNNPTSHLIISRETEFYNGFIRFKMSVTNTTDFVVHDVALDFDFDDVLLQISRYEPDYPTKNGKIILGNISGNSSKTIAIYLDPMMCSKGTDINCQINYKDAKGQPQSTQMEPKKISVVCPIMKTDSDINIGRLKEFVENLPHRDSKVYQLQAGFNIEQLKNITHEIVQKHDVKHIRTLHTKDGKTCEIWYYGKTKVNSHNIVIRITISGDTQSIELFAATPTPESLAGLLAEVGREIKSAIDAKTAGDNVKQVLNVTIKDSIIQRSNLLSFCDINGNCTGDVVIEDSIVQRSEIGLDAQIKDGIMPENDVRTNSCPACEMELPDGAKFCLECGEKIS